jgi:hypothetical protein
MKKDSTMMKKNIILVFLWMLLTACMIRQPSQLTIVSQTEITTLTVEIAKTENERQHGLMNRRDLPENNGMLFVFQQPDIKTFWMKNTLIPLDMIFIADNHKIIHIEKNVPPCQSDPCPVYSSGKPVLYVLEVNGGFTDRHMITEGNTVVLPFPL